MGALRRGARPSRRAESDEAALVGGGFPSKARLHPSVRLLRLAHPRRKFELEQSPRSCMPLIWVKNQSGYRMGQVNSRGERRPSERNSRPVSRVRGEQLPARNGRIPGLQRGDRRTERMLPKRRLGGGRGTVVKPSSVIGLRGSRAPSWHRLRGWSSGRGHSSVRGRRVRPPQVGVRRGPGASISESAWSPIERARPVTAEGSSMSPLPRVPAGRFRRSGTRDCAEAAERLFCGLWSRGNPGRRSDAGRGASGGPDAAL